MEKKKKFHHNYVLMVGLSYHKKGKKTGGRKGVFAIIVLYIVGFLSFSPFLSSSQNASQTRATVLQKGVLKRPKWLSIFWGNKMSFHGFSCWISKQFVCVKVIKDG